MRPTVFSADVLRRFLRRNRIATLPQLKQLLGTEANITVFRKLKELSYRTSYSHRGSFYTLDEIADFNEQGLWSLDSVWFSRHGTLVATTEDRVTQSEAGCFASELEDILHVPVKEPLLQLVAQGRIARHVSLRLISLLRRQSPNAAAAVAGTAIAAGSGRRRIRRLPSRQGFRRTAGSDCPVRQFARRATATSVRRPGVSPVGRRSPDRGTSRSGPAHRGQRATATTGPGCE